MAYGNLIIEFEVDFPKKNSFGKESIEKINNILGETKKNKGKNKKK